MPNGFIQNLVNGMLQRNPAIANNPKAQEAIQAVLSGDAEAGQRIANEICQSNNVTPQEGANQASKWFMNQFSKKV